VLLATTEDDNPVVEGIEDALAVHPDVQVRVFGKPDARPNRRMGVALATATDVDTARDRAKAAASKLRVN
jgi:phosphoribosylglycinamide formyltransferase 2